MLRAELAAATGSEVHAAASRRGCTGAGRCRGSTTSRTPSDRSTSWSTTPASIHRAPLTEFGDTDWDRLLATNLGSAFVTGWAVARHYGLAAGTARSSTCARYRSECRAPPGHCRVLGHQGRLKMLTKGCADLGSHGIQVNGLGPGCHRDGADRSAGRRPRLQCLIRRRTPAGRRGPPVTRSARCLPGLTGVGLSSTATSSTSTAGMQAVL
ncbi:hypothetical protein HBB16_20375 [Pseudonocardia sp. MCCB 268]|nr:hypothetical protein [Pseudonocardia cytotoxica]